MEKEDNINKTRADSYRGHLPPPFYNAKDEFARSQRSSEARGVAADTGNYGVGGHYGNSSRYEVYDLERNRARYGDSAGQPDSYRHLGDRRWINDPVARREHEHSSRYGYRSMDERMHKRDHRGKGPRSYQRSDQRILEDLNEHLYDDPWLNASDIETSVETGEVILSGTVNDRTSKRRAEDIAENVRGVRNVENRIRVLPSIQ